MLKKLKPLPKDHEKDRHFTEFKANDQFPVPELVLFVLRDVLGLDALGPWEKTRWGVSFEYEEAYFSVSLRKSGFTVTTQADHPEGSPLVREVLGKLEKSVGIVEEFLKPFVEEQARDGRVTIANRFHHFERTYRFFREKATEVYGPPESLPVVNGRGNMNGLSAELRAPWRAAREGGYYSEAMMNAYFSRTEHVLVLSLPFLGFEPGGGQLMGFIAEQWSKKIRRFFDFKAESAVKSLYDRMRRIRDALRNPLAHGGFEPGVFSLYFHLPDVGALPARMSRHGDGFSFVINPIGHASFWEICAALDEFDSYLRERLGGGWRWAEAGLDVAYDEQSRSEYFAAAQSVEGIERLIERVSSEGSYHNNFEY
ncbi:hypothetical protein [Corallococcus macrosporus]|uniref:Uncharacterized protein n=1 Tax=Corallococcus macrosporus DSM 14697 TaxID=1189310 RepID=A0A250JRV7_9BACT|nr:hypothetical protein [Corallococcus macrosporus]ATB46370.1 hypothetical protein MYMAC_001962 [Corallococcus macrosporus DSM 14697]